MERKLYRLALGLIFGSTLDLSFEFLVTLQTIHMLHFLKENHLFLEYLCKAYAIAS
jgi:hypothetical protein